MTGQKWRLSNQMKSIQQSVFVTLNQSHIFRQTSKLSKLFVFISDLEIHIHTWIWQPNFKYIVRSNGIIFRVYNIKTIEISIKNYDAKQNKWRRAKRNYQPVIREIEWTKWYEGCHAQFRNLCILRRKLRSYYEFNTGYKSAIECSASWMSMVLIYDTRKY